MRKRNDGPGLFDWDPEKPGYPDAPGFVAGSETSQEAAASVEDSAESMRARVKAYIGRMRSIGSTCDEVEVDLDMIHQTASARIRELFLFGEIEKAGERRKTRRNRNAEVYVVVRRAND